MSRTIGRYQVLGKLGEGGMGEVFAAEDPALGRRVALKTLRAAIADAEARERMRREARAAAAVSHPGICQVYEIGEQSGEIYLAMELLEGEPLSARLARGPLPLGDALDLGLAILDALAAVHARGLVHRDLKPSNVFLTPRGPKLLDFGLALPSAGAGDPRLTRTGFFVGTPAYMAPEQWTGMPLTPGTDLFALGALLVEMIGGAPAFRGSNAAECMQAILHEEPPSLTGGPAVEAADRVIRRALARDPAERWPDAAAMAAALGEARARVDGSERPGAISLRRLLVVPFRLDPPDGELAFLSEGLADAVSTSLSGIAGLAVKSSRFGARYAGAELDPARIAREAEVQFALVGTVRHAGDRLRAQAELLRLPEGSIAWSRTIDAAKGDLFLLQDSLARQIADSLALDLAPSRRPALQADLPANATAYEYFLRASQLGYNFGKLVLARDLYRACLAEDPRYAPAWARLGRVCRVMAKYGHGDGPALLREADEAFSRALALNPDLPIAHGLYAYHEIEELGRSREAMLRLLRQARLNPTDADLWSGLVVALRFCGLLDASLEADRRARRVDPGARTSVAFTYWMRGEYEEALRRDDEDLGWMSYYSLPLLGRAEEAARKCREQERRSAQELERLLVAVDRTANEGDREGCLAAARTILASCFHDPEGRYFIARCLVRIGAVDEGLALLAQVVERGFHCPAPLDRDPWLAPVRADPRFLDARARAGEASAAAAAAYRDAGGEPLLGPAR